MPHAPVAPAHRLDAIDCAFDRFGEAEEFRRLDV